MASLIKTNQELKDAHLPICDWKNLFTIKGDPLSPEDIAALNEHFRHFVPPGPCIKCGAQQGLDPDDVIGGLMGKGKFVWAIQHGEGFCSTKGCGWPARAIHYDIGPIKSLNMILQYHPDSVSWKE